MSNLRIAWERHRRGVSRAVSSESRSIAGSPDRLAIVNACNRANRTRLLPVTHPPSGVRRPNGRTGKKRQPKASRLAAGEGTGSGREASRLAAGEGTGFRPGGILARSRRGYGFLAGRVGALGGERCGLRAGDRTAFIREGGYVEWGYPCPQPKSLRLVPEQRCARLGCGGSGYGCGGVQPRRGGCYQPGTLRSDAAAIWKYRHSASSYSGSSASSSSAARMCRSHASCAAIPIAKRA
jgi:hypothetical protein